MKIIVLPPIFRLQQPSLKNTIKVLIELIRPKNKDIAIDFSELKITSKGDLMVLLAQLEKTIITNKNKVYRKKGIPKNKEVKKLLLTSMDLLHVNKKISINKFEESERAKLLNPIIVDSVVKSLKRIGIRDYFSPFYEFLIELIANAVEHGINNNNINWWLTHEIDWKTKAIKYTFVDMGLGIIGSHKKAGLPFKYNFLSDKHILLDALNAKLRSSTKESNRGRGLPQISDIIKKGFVSDLILISNNVSLHFESETFKSSRNGCFSGTYFSWTIDKNCFQKWKKSV